MVETCVWQNVKQKYITTRLMVAKHNPRKKRKQTRKSSSPYGCKIHNKSKKKQKISSYQYSNVRYGTTDPGGRFLRSASQRAIHAEILARLAALSTFTVATMRVQSSDSAKHVSSKNELCSEYGTPKSCAAGVEPRAGRRCACVNSRCGGRARMEAMDGVVLVPAGGE